MNAAAVQRKSLWISERVVELKRGYVCGVVLKDQEERRKNVIDRTHVGVRVDHVRSYRIFRAWLKNAEKVASHPDFDGWVDTIRTRTVHHNLHIVGLRLCFVPEFEVVLDHAVGIRRTSRDKA